MRKTLFSPSCLTRVRRYEPFPSWCLSKANLKPGTMCRTVPAPSISTARVSSLSMTTRARTSPYGKIFWISAGPVAPSRRDAVERLRVAARKPVELPLVRVGEPQLVRDGPDLERVLEEEDLLEVVRRDLEAPVAERHLAARQRLLLLPDRDPVLVPDSALERVVVEGAGAGKVVVRTAVGDDERVVSVLVPEEPADPLLLHQPAGEGEVVLAVLEAHLPRLVRAARA